jgi:hypothetical protein
VKKIVVILLMFTYGSATIGATVHLHYCMNKLVGWSLWYNEKEECIGCGMKEDKTGCCKDEHKYFKIKVDHQKAAVAAFITNIFTPAVVASYTDSNFQPFLKATEDYSPCHAPPDIGLTKLHVLHGVFLI